VGEHELLVAVLELDRSQQIRAVRSSFEVERYLLQLLFEKFIMGIITDSTSKRARRFRVA
jgi:hypothetical protein